MNRLLEAYETQHTSELRRRGRQMRMRRNFQDTVDEARDSPRDLLEVSSVFHGQTKTGRYGGTRGEIPEKVQENYLSRGIPN